jgi:23S rRNA (uridine2552-2'-O)-methyltransferase
VPYRPNDFYARKAKKEHFAARSVYKLEAIDQKLRLFSSGQQVLDLGAAPGSWSQYIAARIGKGIVIGIDLKPIGLEIANARFIMADFFEFDLANYLASEQLADQFDVVVSDMAPATTGMRVTDQARSLALCELALETAHRFLKLGGAFVCKLFESGDAPAFRKQLMQSFEKVQTFRPESTRKESKEIFLTGLHYLGMPAAKTI